MKKIFIILLMVIFACISKITVNAQSDCDIVFDFETEATSYVGQNSSVTWVSNYYGNSALKLKNTSSNYSPTLVGLQVTIDGNKTLVQAFDNITFYLAGVNDNALYSKPAQFGVSSDGTSYNVTAGTATNIDGKAWAKQSVAVSQLPTAFQNMTGTFYIGIGVSIEKDNEFHVSNVKLEAKESACVPDLPVPTITTTPTLGSVDCGQTLADVSISGGEAQYESETVSGTFAFKNPAEKVKLSDNGITEFDLVFTPADETVYSKIATKVTLTVNDNGDCDPCNTPSGYFMIDCFENSTIDAAYGMQGSNGSATVKSDPKNASNQAIYVDPKNWDNYLKIEVTLPCGKTIAEYSKIKFDINREKGSNNDFRIGFNTSLGNNSGDIRENFSITNGQWVNKEFDIPAATSTNNTFTFYIGYRGSNNDAYYLDNIMLEEKTGTACPTHLTWNGSISSEWTVKLNWTPPENTVSAIPNPTMDITIPGNLSHYPSVPEKNTAVKSIVFQPGAEIANQHCLTGNYKAYVQYDFSSDAARDRWHMLSIPFLETFVGDFTFGGYPRTFFLPFGTNGWEAGNTFANNKKLTAGDAFLFWVEGVTYSAGAEKGLGKKSGILEIPFFESDIIKGSGVHPNHELNGSTSTFYNFKKESDEYVNSETLVTAARTTDAYKLAGKTVSVPLVFAYDDNYKSNFALVGNPFMSTIDFTALAESNTTRIKKNYQVWTGKGDAAGFVGYHPEGNFGVDVDVDVDETADEYIAPLQSFFVEKSDTYADGTLEFNISVTASATGKGTLRNSVNTNNKLEITASNETASVLAFIAQRPEGQTTVGNADARKMLNDVSSLPEVYTLKPTANGSIAVLGANIIPAGEALIPVGLFTSHTGAMSLTFKGMDSYENTTITLIDNATDNKEIDLTGLSSYRYDFDFEPATAGNEILPVEDRFAIRFAPSTPTGVHTPSVSALVYSKNQSIHIVSDASNLIKQIQIYNAQGILVHTGDQLNTSSYIVDYPANAGVCIVKVITKQGIKNVKLIK